MEFGQKGLMMELQSLQEALKVEIQIHQVINNCHKKSCVNPGGGKHTIHYNDKRKWEK